MASAPPTADTKKPATPPPSKDGKGNGDKAAAATGAKAPDTGATRNQAATQNKSGAGKANETQGAAGGATGTAASQSTAASQQRFDRMAVRAKLAVSEPGDAVEREADAVADKVMRMPEPAGNERKQTAKPVATPPGKPDEVKRKEGPNSKVSPVKSPPAQGAAQANANNGKQDVGKPASGAPAATTTGKPGEEIKRKENASGTGGDSSQSAANQPGTTQELIEKLGSGEPLDADTRAFFEQRLGRDLSGVLIHADNTAADAAHKLQARAFTFGNHIAFAAGEYQPQSAQGRHLLAHELAHVLQNDTMGVGSVIRRKAGNTKYSDPNNLSKDAIDPTKDKKARPALETLKLPAIKARHAPEYKSRAKKTLKRPKGYDRDDKTNKPQFQTEQLKNWKDGITLTLPDIYTKIGLKTEPSPPSVTFYGAKKRILNGTPGELLEQLKVPKWSPDGTWFETGMQIDHIVEAQVGGEDAFSNYELLSGPHNNSSGAKLSQSIRAGLRQYLSGVDKSPSPANVNKYLEENDINFQKVEGGAESNTNKESGAQFWSRMQIQKGEHLSWLKDDPRAANDDGTKPNRFVLYSFTGNGFIDAYDLKGNVVAVINKGRLNGIELHSITLNPGFDKVTSGVIGKLQGSWELPKGVEGPKEKFEVNLTAISGKPYAGAMATLPPPTLQQKGASPITFQEIGFAQGGVFADGTLSTTHPLFSGVQIPVRWRGKSLAFEYTFSATDLQGKLPLPGITVDDASLTLSLGSEGLGAEGSIGFTVTGFGNGYLSVGVQGGKDDPVLTAKGKLIADRKLFDQAEIELGYTSEQGFYGKGVLGITTPDKIKGIKSAKLTASYAKSVFNATGNIEPDIPGLKSASLSVTYDKTLIISGQLGIDDKVPGVEAAQITVTVKQVGDKWKVAATGEVTPKLPGLSGPKLNFNYDDGFVLLEAKFSIKKGPLDGEFFAGVTNAKVNAKGEREKSGSGKTFTAYGSAMIKAEFIKDKLTGKLRLRLQPDGTIRVGGGFEVKDFEVFPKTPENDELFKKEINSPKIPIPGLGFSVGSVSVGVTFWGSGSFRAFASVGPGQLKGISIDIDEFDPDKVVFADLTIRGQGSFEVPANAGIELGAAAHIGVSAAIVDLDGKIGITGKVDIPEAKQPVLKATSKFQYNEKAGLDIMNDIKLSIQPALEFTLKGGVSVNLNLLVDTITLWSKDWTLSRASFDLPIGINAKGKLGYNSKKGLTTKVADLLTVEKPDFDKPDNMLKVLDGSGPDPTIMNVDAEGQEVPPDQLMSLAPEPELQVCSMDQTESFYSEEPNQSVMPKREDGSEAAAPAAVDKNVVNRLGTGMPLDLSTRGYFEQRMNTDLSGVQIHVGRSAAQEAGRLSAKAFTVGEHIAFAQGEYRPNTPEGQELIAHELAHVAQQNGHARAPLSNFPPQTGERANESLRELPVNGGGAEQIILRWPTVTRTDASTSETPATIRARSLSGFVSLTQTQLDWATSPALQADAAALGQFRDLQTFADGPNITQACGGLNVGGIIGRGIPAVYPALRKYTEGVTSGSTAWLRRTDDIVKAERWGTGLTTLEAAWPAANLSLVMRAPDPVSNPSPFERLEDPARPELPNFISFLTACSPILSADDGSEVDSFLSLRREGAMPNSYAATITHVRNYHHFTKATLDGLVTNEAVPQWRQRWSWTQRPLTVVLYPAIDHNGAFHRNLGLQSMVTNSDILTIVIEGHASVSDYQTQLAPVASRYGANGEIQQAMIGGHGNATILQLAGTMSGAGTTIDTLGTTGAEGANTTGLMTELTRLMSSDPARRRIVLDACLTNSHAVTSALRASPADAAADVNAAVTANPSLRDFVAGMAGAGANVFGSNSSFAPSQTTFMTSGTTDIGLSVPGDPDLIASKLAYVEFGTEPEGCMRALLECWAADQLAGTFDCRDAVRRRIGAGASTHVPVVHRDTWRESIIQPIYSLAVNHYWGNGEALRQMGFLAGSVFELFWPGHTTASSLNTRLAVLSNAAHIDQLFNRVSAEPHYAANPRVAVVIEQAWMQHTPARRNQFLTALGRYATCLEASADVDMGMVMAHVPSLLTMPPASPPPGDQLRLALMAADHAPVGLPLPTPLPRHIAFLRHLRGAGPDFPDALNIDTVLGGLADTSDILAAIGYPLAGGAPDPLGPPPDANIDTVRDATSKNDFRVSPLRANGVVATARDDLMVRSTPTTSTTSNIFNRLPTGTRVFIIGTYGRWYAIEQAGRTGFVSKRYITLTP